MTDGQRAEDEALRNLAMAWCERPDAPSVSARRVANPVEAYIAGYRAGEATGARELSLRRMVADEIDGKQADLRGAMRFVPSDEEAAAIVAEHFAALAQPPSREEADRGE